LEGLELAKLTGSRTDSRTGNLLFYRKGNNQEKTGNKEKKQRTLISKDMSPFNQGNNLVMREDMALSD
jgi:hypothetical protein